MPLHKPVTSPKGGRPYVDVTPQELEQIERLGAYLNKKQIAHALGMSENTFLRICRDNESVDAAYKKARANKIEKVADALYKNAVEKNSVIAQIFFLKAVGKWQEAQPEAEQQTINITYAPTQGRVEKEVFSPAPESIGHDDDRDGA
jgi:IS30 family transposase